MANFDIPFATSAARRSPTNDEKANGFPCGGADQTLFNGLFHRLEAELGNVITYAGLTPSDADFSQVRKAIVALIEAATGGGETENYLLLNQATARLPIYPEVQSADGRINFTQPAAGTVRMPGGVNLLHRGISVVTTSQTDFETLASRVYHLRWSPQNGFQLKLLTDPTYNPNSYPETHAEFDSTFDDVLLARVVTNSGNVATVTSLANKHDLRASGELDTAMTNAEFDNDVLPSQISKFRTISLNWARSPQAYMTAANDIRADHREATGAGFFGEFSIGVRTESRYAIAVWGQGDIDIRMGWAART